MSPEEMERLERARELVSLRLELGLCCTCGRVLHRRRFELYFCGECEPQPRCSVCDRHVALGTSRCTDCQLAEEVEVELGEAER